MRVIYFIALYIIVTAGCKKSTTSLLPLENSGLIYSHWELRIISGSIAGVTTYAPGNGIIRTFRSDSFFAYTNQGDTISKGNFTIYNIAGTPKWLLKLNYINQQFDMDTVEFGNNTITFLSSASCCDIPSITYEAIP